MKKLKVAFIFVLIAVIASNVIYYRWCQNKATQVLKQPQIEQADSLHSEISANDFKRDSLLSWLNTDKFHSIEQLNKLKEFVNKYPDAVFECKFDRNGYRWVWAYGICDTKTLKVCLVTIDYNHQIITSL